MSIEDISRYLKESRTIILVSNGKNGYPHPMPMWYAVDDENTVYMTTFKKSQKIKNLKRDPRVALLVESGDSYDQLKSVLIYTKVDLIEDLEKTRDILMKISIQRGDLSDDSDETIRQGMLKTAGKRMGMMFTPEKIVSWDHSKLGGVYWDPLKIKINKVLIKEFWFGDPASIYLWEFAYKVYLWDALEVLSQNLWI